MKLMMKIAVYCSGAAKWRAHETGIKTNKRLI